MDLNRIKGISLANRFLQDFFEASRASGNTLIDLSLKEWEMNQPKQHNFTDLTTSPYVVVICADE
jgi:hypothetical protein